MRSKIKKALELAVWFLAGFMISTLILLPGRQEEKTPPAAEDSVPAQTENNINA